MSRLSPPEAFFLPAPGGSRFCLFFPPRTPVRGAVLHVPPFAEEMNKVRRMVALQSRVLAGLGYGVLQVDLLGTGDSSGDFADARWDAWKDDLALGCRWLTERCPGPLNLWAMRLGALLALDFARGAGLVPERVVLWQPVASGEQFFTQFLRLKLASEMMAEGQSRTGTRELRAQLAAGKPLEIAGYEIAPELAAAMDGMRLASLAPVGSAVTWLEVAGEASRQLPPGSQRVADGWVAAGVPVAAQVVAGDPFWATQEIAEAPELIAATAEAFAAAPPTGVRGIGAGSGT